MTRSYRKLEENLRRWTSLLCVGCGVALSACGAEYTWTNALGDGDWTKPGNFIAGIVPEPTGEEDAATVLPGADDVVVLPLNAAVVLEYDTADEAKKASCEAFAAVKSVRPYDGSTVEITVPANTTYPLACSLSRGTELSNSEVGHLIKRGAGDLVLNAAGTIASGSHYYDYYCKMTVDEGVVRVVPDAVEAAIHLGNVTVNENGTLFTANTTGNVSGSQTVLRYLYGSGTITNDTADSSSQRMIVDRYGDFSGRITGKIYYYSPGYMRFTGTESTFSVFVVYKNYGHGFQEGYGTAEIAKFGMKGVDGVYSPSSIGYSGTVLVRDNAAAIRYIGTGETTDKDLRFWPQHTTYPLYLDGGPHGGLHWTGIWGHRDTDANYEYTMMRLILQGSHTNDCVMSGVIESRINNATPGTNYTFCITKRGTGTWSIRHNDNSRMLGVWRVVDGTLKFDTIAEKGKNSALGSSTMLYKDLNGVLAIDSNNVDYAFWLGGGEGGPRANLEYVGETNCVSTTRLFALNGTGAVLNNGTGRLRLEGFFATNTASTLVLGGTNVSENVVDRIADGGNATMSVVKEGSGTWRLGTNCTFTGALDVKGGRLVVGNDELYNYYRWVIRATYCTTTAHSKERVFGLKSFGLFDAEGNDRVYALSHEGDWYAYGDKAYYASYPYSFLHFSNELALDEGHFRFTHYDGTVFPFTTGGHDEVSNLFAHVEYRPAMYSRASGAVPPTYGSEATWVVITMRPKAGAPITSWDYVNEYSGETYQMISNCVLEASVDGRNWDRLAEVTNDTRPTRNTWQSDAFAYQVGYTTHTTGMPIPPGPTNAVAFAASSVSVAAGAELVSRAPGKPVISALAVDGTAGGGKIEGFAFAPGCAVNVVNPPSGASYEVPMALVDVEGLDASNGWTVSVGGTPKANLRISASSTGLLIRPVGTQFILR